MEMECIIKEGKFYLTYIHLIEASLMI